MQQPHTIEYFQEFMPENVCYGCGLHNDQGLQIKSYWEGAESVCHWTPQPHHHGWKGLLNGGIIATLIDCHCMCTAMAASYKEEGRGLGSLPEYRYATGTLNVKYLKPTPMKAALSLRAEVLEIKGRKTTMKCSFFAGEVCTAEAEVIAIRVFDSSKDTGGSPFGG
ncbi:MAG: PaaI family thioesterase [Bacteroidota bacterium]